MVVTLEEGTESHGWGSAINNKSPNKHQKFVRIASDNCPIPSNKFLELALMPTADTIVETIRRGNNV